MNKQLILYLLVWLDGLVFPCFVLTSYVGRVRVSVCVSVCVPQDCQCASGGVSGCVWTSEEAVVCIFVFGVILFGWVDSDNSSYDAWGATRALTLTRCTN